MKIYKIILFALATIALAACSAIQQTAPPTETLKAFIEASQKKDVENIKKNLSKGSLELIEKSAQTQNTTVDELLKKDDPAQLKEIPETRNEKIDGETATVEVKNHVTGEFETLPFVKEDGAWKLALDKFIQDLMKKMPNEMKMPAQNSNSGAALPDADKNAENSANKSKTNRKN